MYARPHSENGEPTTFGVSGKLWRDALIMYDRSSRSLWSQIDGVAKAGPLTGQRLKKISSQLTTWAEWKRSHPETQVLVKPPLEKSPYASYHDGAPWVGLPWTRGGRDERLPPKTLVLGMDVDGTVAAVSLETLDREKVVLGTLGGEPMMVVAPDDPRSAQVFRPRVGERRLDFDWRQGRLVDRQTGSLWDPEVGVAVSGELKGERLEAVAATPIYWSTWIAFHPQSALWEGKCRRKP